MKVLFYGRLADAIGREIEVAAPGGCSVGDVRRRVAASHVAAAAELDRSRTLIADRLVGDDQPVDEADELEFLPPVSGG